MTSYVEENDLEAFLNVLQEQLGVTTSLNQSQIDSVGLTVTKVKRRAKITPPPPEKELKIDARLLELEAEALELELELLSF